VNPHERTLWICDRALAAGFDLCGVVAAEPYGELENFPEWIARGYAGEMSYLKDPRRIDPRLVLEGARSLIVVAVNYNSAWGGSSQTQTGNSHHAARGWISRYAWGDDYHDLILQKLQALIIETRSRFAESFEARAYVDTGPILERVAAKYAGLGWLAKNTCLINQNLGSWLFLGVIITTLDLEPTPRADAMPPPDLCGSCRRCLDACPTQAFPEPYVLDARRCISYLTIELRGSIPEELRGTMGDAVIGCDICQDVCPWNRKAPITTAQEFQPRLFPASDRHEQESLFRPSLRWLVALSQEDFSRIFRKSAAKRAKWRGIVRNACVALGNSALEKTSVEYQRAITLLKKLAVSDDDLISEHARWAIDRLSPDEKMASASD
jgi:epoxyqueuosine reductase